MTDRHHPNIHMRWTETADKHRWMRSLATILDAIDRGAILKSDRERETFKLVRERLEREFEFEHLPWPLDE
jgi:hypothetical protein